jgi:signal transduction histidine kinase
VRYTEVSVLMFAFLVVLQVGIVRFALAPLHRVQQDVGRLERGETEQLSDRVPAEVLPLVREVNRLLALQARRLQRSRSALGNLAHALKAPLTVLTHMANDEHLGAQPTLRAHMTEQLAAMRTRIDSELRRARVAGGCSPGTMVDVPKEIDALVAAVRMLYRERNLDIACDVDAAARFHGDREDLLELCGNLLDNACKWARSQVRISARRNEGVTLAVEDDGPGCSPEDLKRITQRGVRLDESVEGHGLGLAIASDIAASYGVQLRFDRSENLGGLRARVDFPAL